MPITRKMIVGTSTRNLLFAHEHEELTYPNVGMSLAPADAPAPEGRWHKVNESRTIGHGRDAFMAVGDALMHWRLNTEAGFFVQARNPVVVQDEAVAIGLPVWFMAVTAICRVVAIVDEPHRTGFAYGTLPGHPETGEESFVVEHLDDDSVVLTVRALSRPAVWFTKLGGPIATSVQRKATKRYFDAAARIAERA